MATRGSTTIATTIAIAVAVAVRAALTGTRGLRDMAEVKFGESPTLVATTLDSVHARLEEGAIRTSTELDDCLTFPHIAQDLRVDQGTTRTRNGCAITPSRTGGNIAMAALTGRESAGLGKFLGNYIPHLDNEMADFRVGLAGHSVIGRVRVESPQKSMAGILEMALPKGHEPRRMDLLLMESCLYMVIGLLCGLRKPKQVGGSMASLTAAWNWITSLLFSGGAGTKSANFAGQLALERGKSGAAQGIMQGSIKNPGFSANAWARMQYVSHDT